MELCCGQCHVELKDHDEVVMDDFGCMRHKGCFNYANGLHLIDTVGICKEVRGHFPRFLLDTYKEILAMDEFELRSADQITDQDVIDAFAFTLGYLD